MQEDVACCEQGSGGGAGPGVGSAWAAVMSRGGTCQRFSSVPTSWAQAALSSKPALPFPGCETVGKPGSLRSLGVLVGAVGTVLQARVDGHRAGGGQAEGVQAQVYDREALPNTIPVPARVSHTSSTRDFSSVMKKVGGSLATSCLRLRHC